MSHDESTRAKRRNDYLLLGVSARKNGCPFPVAEYRIPTPLGIGLTGDDMKDIRRGLWLIAAGLWLLVGVTYVHADDVRGCYAQYNPNTGQFIYEPFLKVADKDSPSEDGFAEVWGFRPWNLEPPDKEGKTHPVNILEGMFIPMGENKPVLMYRNNADKKKATRCPEHLW